MKYVLLAILTTSVLTGCGTIKDSLNTHPPDRTNTPRWAHDTKSKTEFYADKSQCKAEAGQATPNGPNLAGSRHAWYGSEREDLFEDCMTGKGWFDPSTKTSKN